jgi:LacI family transcriptional regulator
MELVRFRIVDIAREAGVSVATVDRVINNRVGVRADTRERVLSVAARLGYLVSPQSTPSQRVKRLDFVLPGGTNTFINNLAGELALAAEARSDDASATVHRIEGFNPTALAGKLDEIGSETDGIGLIALDHPAIRESLRAIAARGIPVVTLVSDIPNAGRRAYIGIDNRAAGRLAGHVMGRFLGLAGGKVVLFIGSLSYRGHEEREMGFRRILKEEYPRLSVADLLEVQDDVATAYEQAARAIAQHADLAGIYSMGGGNRGIAKALVEAGREREVVFIAHEVTEHTRRYLLSGVIDAVIDQDGRGEAAAAVEALIAAASGRKLPPAQIRTQLVLKENIP